MSAPTWSNVGAFPTGFVGVGYNTDFSPLDGASSGPVTITLTAGSLPPGVSLASVSSAVYTVSGTPTSAGVFNFTLHAVNGAGSADATFSVLVVAVVAATTAAPTGAMTQETLAGLTKASRTEGAGYFQRFYALVPSPASLAPALFTATSQAPTGALSRELLTGSTYTARTEGAGLLRQQLAPIPAATTATLAQETLSGPTKAAHTEGAGYLPIARALYPAASPAALTWSVNGYTDAWSAVAPILNRWWMTGSTAVQFGAAVIANVVSHWNAGGSTRFAFLLWRVSGAAGLSAGAAVSPPALAWNANGAANALLNTFAVTVDAWTANGAASFEAFSTRPWSAAGAMVVLWSGGGTLTTAAANVVFSAAPASPSAATSAAGATSARFVAATMTAAATVGPAITPTHNYVF